jgi:hypothetical protein
MVGFARRYSVVVAAGLVLAALAPEASAQTITSTPYSAYGAATYSSPYWGYVEDPYGAYLRGAAQVISAQGQFMVSQMQAYRLKEDVRAARIDNRKKALDQWLYERENIPTPQEEAIRFQNEQLRMARFGSDLTEIWSAKALNQLLADAKKIRSPGSAAANTALSEDVLAKINVTSGKSGGNIGLFKSGRVPWPVLLRRRAFESPREQIDHLVEQAIKEASTGQSIDADVLLSINKGITALGDALVAYARDSQGDGSWSMTMYLDAKTFLDQFDDAVKVLQQPDAANYLNGKYAVRGKDIGEVVKWMTDNGLQFAPVTTGGEAAYKALYSALQAFDSEAGSQIKPSK